MNFRRRLLTAFALTVSLAVAAVTWIAFTLTRRSFGRANNERAAALVAQFRREFDRRGAEVARRIEAISGGEDAARLALAVNRGAPDYGSYVGVARGVAESQRLDFLEFLDDQGTIISSAQWPAKFGYKELSLPSAPLPNDVFLRQEALPEGAALGLSAVRQVRIGDKPLFVIGGVRLDKGFLASLDLPAGTRAMLYANLQSGFSPQSLIDPSGTVQHPEALSPLIQQVQMHRQEAGALIRWSSDAAEDETVQAIPLPGENGQLLGILLVGNSRHQYVELRQQIGSAALLAGAAGIGLAIVFSGWAAVRVTRPVEQLAEAVREVTSGNWSAYVPVTSADEIGELADSFNRMTHELLAQKDRLVQTERVAAWRELARRLAHELKNPLFPLQLTVENLLRARQQSPGQFEEIFQESASTLLGEIANLKQIISRFSDFSRMPQPALQAVNLNEIAEDVVRLHQAQLSTPGRPAISCKLELAEPMDTVRGDPELLHRALSNLVLNAMDAMPQGGTLTLRTRQDDSRGFIEVSDTGAGLTPGECARLFTPYYTTKAHGTGLGLAIVQSVISDHGGKVGVSSQPGSGTTFVIELPR
jgi:two-component system, NtrC family, nitrogen regulation sensor histidine kinase NtrY